MVEPEALNLNQALLAQDLFSPYDDLPLPAYLEQENLSDFENRASCMRFMVSNEHLATLSKHELLFGFTKNSKYWHGGIL